MDVAFRKGDHEEALSLIGDASRIAWELGDQGQAAEALLTSAGIVAWLGDEPRAARIWGAGEMALRRMGIASPAGFLSLPAAAQIRAILENPAYAAEVDAGHALSLEEATAMVLGMGNPARDSGLRPQSGKESSR